MHLRNILQTVCLVFLFQPLLSQAYQVQQHQFDVRDGMIGKDVLTIVEGPEGFIWIGSAEGIQRYDGIDFKNWNRESRTGQIFQVGALGFDREGWLWIWNDELHAFVFLNLITEEIKTQTERFGTEFPSRLQNWRRTYHQIFTDDDGKMYFFLKDPNQLIVYDSNLGFTIHDLSWLQGNQTELVWVGGKDQLWFASDNSRLLLLADSEGNLLKEYQVRENRRIKVMEASEDFLVFLDENGLNEAQLKKLDLKTGKLGKSVPIDPKTQFLFYQNELLWELKDHKWTIFEKEKPVSRFEEIRNTSSSINIISNVALDQFGGIWLFGGRHVTHISLNPSKFETLLCSKPEEKKPFIGATRGICVLRDTVYAAAEFQGVVAIPRSHPDEMIVLDGKFDSESIFFGAGPLIALRNGEIVVGAHGWLYYYKGTQVVKRLKINVSTYPEFKDLPQDHLGIWSLDEDQDAQLWIGTSNGLWLQKENEVYEYFPIANRPGQLNDIYQIMPDKHGNLWLITASGLFIFNPIKKKITAHFGKDEMKDHYLPMDASYCLTYLLSGEIAIGTSDGLIIWNKKSDSFRHVSIRDGLSGKEIYSVFESNDGLIWMATDNGINCLDRKANYVRVFSEEDGISHNEFNRISGFQASDGTLYFGGLNGITSFDPSLLKLPDVSTCKLQITDFEILEGNTRKLVNKTGALRMQSQIVWNPEDLYCKIRFAIPESRNNAHPLFAWRLIGVDSNWIFQKENLLQLTSLPYGNHILEIKGQTGRGNWTEVKRITIQVVKPFYIQTWFIVLLVVLFLALGITVFQHRIRMLRIRQIHLQEKIREATDQIVRDKELIEKQAEELRTLDEIKSRFFSNVAHELRTPLTLILAPLNSALNSSNLNEQARRYLAIASENAKVLLKLVSSLLDLSKLESGKMKLNEVDFSLHQFCLRVVANFESHIQQLEIRFQFDYQADEDLVIHADREKLETVLNNLIANAAKFTPAGKQITLRVEADDENVRIKVIDTGRGIHPVDLPRIFGRFYQSSLENIPAEGGTGIGLALCKELLKVMGGDITAESELHKGSTFSLYFPRKTGFAKTWGEDEATEDSVETMDFVSQPIGLNHPKKILIVEDNPNLREYLVSILHEDYQLETASNGLKALEYLEKSGASDLPELILSDIMMPEMDGYQLLNALKEHPQYWSIPVIMLTARASTDDKLKALRMGVDDYLLKPFEEEELKVRINNLITNLGNRTSAHTEETEETAPGLPERDRQWLISLEECVKTNIENEEFGLADLMQEFSMSESTLLRRVKGLTGMSPNEYVREHRLVYALQLLEKGHFYSISEVAFAAGFKDPKTFSRTFKNRFGRTPSSYAV